MSSGYGEIVKAPVLSRYARGAFNAHPSLLPSYRGRHAVIQWAIDEGERVLGVTIHRMSSVVDQGDLIMMRSCRFGPELCYSEISETLSRIASEMLVELIYRISAGI